MMFWRPEVPSFCTRFSNTLGLSSRLEASSSNQKRTSSVVNGSPSDHIIPRRNSKVQTRAPSDGVADLNTCG